MNNSFIGMRRNLTSLECEDVSIYTFLLHLGFKFSYLTYNLNENLLHFNKALWEKLFARIQVVVSRNFYYFTFYII